MKERFNNNKIISILVILFILALIGNIMMIQYAFKDDIIKALPVVICLLIVITCFIKYLKD